MGRGPPRLSVPSPEERRAPPGAAGRGSALTLIDQRAATARAMSSGVTGIRSISIPSRREGVVDCVEDRRRRADRPALAHPLRPVALTIDGVSRWAISIGGTSVAVGTK